MPDTIEKKWKINLYFGLYFWVYSTQVLCNTNFPTLNFRNSAKFSTLLCLAYKFFKFKTNFQQSALPPKPGNHGQLPRSVVWLKGCVNLSSLGRKTRKWFYLCWLFLIKHLKMHFQQLTKTIFILIFKKQYFLCHMLFIIKMKQHPALKIKRW